ncbi:hypothetical protein Q9966_005893 [Columba livia]|nr:hypothetical protein Q9966_005893 [Columba livia]
MHLWKGEDGANLCISSVPHEPRTRPEDRLWEASQETSLPCRGDQILEADSVSLRHAAFSEAYGILGECGPGPVSLITSQHPNAKNGIPRAFRFLKLVIQSNWGKPGYTCIYRVQVHGKIVEANDTGQAGVEVLSQ